MLLFSEDGATKMSQRKLKKATSKINFYQSNTFILTCLQKNALQITHASKA